MIKEKRTLKNNNNNLACVESKSHILNSSVSLQSLFSDNSPHLTFIKKKKKADGQHISYHSMECLHMLD